MYDKNIQGFKHKENMTNYIDENMTNMTKQSDEFMLNMASIFTYRILIWTVLG